MSKFYAGRKGHKYYAQVKAWLDSYGERDSILDIGSADTPVASWGTFRHRHTIDPRFQPDLEHVVSVQGHWPEDAGLVPRRVEVITCLQVLEHIQDVQPFVDAIFAAATYRVILSVPYKWKAGATQGHIHDPVSREKLRGWTRRQPLRTTVIDDRGSSRLVEEYSGEKHGK